MADFNTNGAEEALINIITKSKNSGFEIETDKYQAIRVALALSLKMKTCKIDQICEKLDSIDANLSGKEYNLEQITDKGKSSDFDTLIRALLFARHSNELKDKDIFNDDKLYLKILSAYIHRGFYELDRTFKRSDNFYIWLKDNFNLNSALPPKNTINSLTQNEIDPNEIFEKIRKFYL